ncbi:P-loop containing nucleoside triphosphate hydrolase protein [Suillus clintonianus]|uniref:P-loop containing nucleoside triphosphate hydrolase protein n=1 Tax=Suillus clintonianus TaxID=1904413 RepID=UPI001B85D05C|nr:P-loop containing nucleoside triphosphate hydrolase protein [Suillus clintonianus]KAG2152811.1 P-loop containing nucleoside triphosphate hydrolase protein [Suillus clintonianus]
MHIPTEDYYPGTSAPLPPSQRSDWRLRATSRTHRTQLFDAQRHRRYIKRVNPPHIQVQQGEPFFEEIQAYNKHFLSLLESEQAEDEAVLRERLSTWSLLRLQEEGYTISGLSAFWMGAPKFGRPVASFSLGPGIDLPEHRFENGTQVLVSRFDPLQEPPHRGSVLSRTASQLRVAFEEKFDIEDGCWRLDIGRSNIVFIRMREAISRFNHDPQALEDRTQLISSPDNQFILHGTHLRDVLLRSFSPDRPSLHAPLQPPDEVEYVPRGRLEHDSREVREHGGAFKEDMHIQSWARRYSQINPIIIDGDPVLEGLNATQIRAIAMMISERISLVQGPPGTGKTKTIIEAVKLLKVHFEVHHPLLVCTYTNVAVDNLVEGFAAAGVKPLRVGFGAKIKSSLYEYTLDAKLEAHPLKPKVDQLLKDQENAEKKLGALEQRIVEAEKSGSEKLSNMRTALTVLERQVLALRAKLYALHQEMLNSITAAADVICTTCITSASAALNILDFPVVFLDEASMSTEPASLIPLMRGSQHVALIGDHKQLPPVITSREAQLNGLGISLFERLTEEGVVPSIMLDVQYRMHPSISRFPSLEFYDLALQDGTVDSAGNIHPMLLPPLSSHLEQNVLTGHRPSVVFIDHGGAETYKDRSRVNWNEAYIVCSIVEDLLLQNENLQGANIGVIAPYAAQISLLYRLLNTDAKYRKRFASTLGDHRMMQLSSIEVKTVDGFEGREKDVIIFSTVRNNTSGYIGFLADRRRLNVGLTRAKRGLFVVGSISTLKAGKMAKGRLGEGPARVGKGAEAWRKYAKYLLEENMVLTLSGDKLRNVLYGHAAKATLS